MNKNEKKCPYDPSHIVEEDEDGHLFCKTHREDWKPYNTPLYNSRIDELKRSWLLHNALEYKEKVQEMASTRTITNEKLKSYFEDFKNKNLRIDVLQELFGPMNPGERPLVKLNWPQDPDKQTAVVPSSYMRRLSTYTRKRWKQKRLKGEDGTELIRFWTDGKYDPEKEREKREQRRRMREEKKDAKNLEEAHEAHRKKNEEKK